MTEDRQFLKRVYRDLDDRPLEPGDPRYQPPFEHPGCEDHIVKLQNSIEFADGESLNLFSGFRGSGKTTQLFRLRERLQQNGYVVLYADALNYVSPAQPIDIAELLTILAGAFSDALQQLSIDLVTEGYWTRFSHWLTKTEIAGKELGLKVEGGADPAKIGAELKLEIKTSPTFRQKLSKALNGRIGEFDAEVKKFFEDGFKAIRQIRGEDAQVVFIFDSLEQVRGSLSNEQEVMRSIEVLFSNYLNLLAIPYLHVIYTVPPWLTLLPGMHMTVLLCVRMWHKGPGRPEFDPGIGTLRGLVEKRFPDGGLERFFGPKPFERADRLIKLCGGHFRDLLLLLRETVLRANSLPATDEAIDAAIVQVKTDFLPISLEDALWLAQIEREHTTVLKSSAPKEVSRLTKYLDTHIVLYLRNGEDWFDVHPLVREEVRAIAAQAAAAAPSV